MRLRPIDPRFSRYFYCDVVQVVCPLTQDRQLLRDQIDHMEKPQGAQSFGTHCVMFLQFSMLQETHCGEVR